MNKWDGLKMSCPQAALSLSCPVPQLHYAQGASKLPPGCPKVAPSYKYLCPSSSPLAKILSPKLSSVRNIISALIAENIYAHGWKYLWPSHGQKYLLLSPWPKIFMVLTWIKIFIALPWTKIFMALPWPKMLKVPLLSILKKIQARKQQQ